MEKDIQEKETIIEEINKQEQVAENDQKHAQGNEKEASPSEQVEVEESPSESVEELKKKLDEYENRIYRLQADFDNFRRRTKMEREAAEKYRAQNIVTDILPVIDNFERALKVEIEDEKAKSILQGMEMVYRQLCDALKKEGVEVITSIGNQFDPHQHQAVMQVQEEDYEPNTVIEEFQKGYKLKDRVIRPSMVKVNG